MRLLTILVGALFVIGGTFLAAAGGITFISVAFPVGIAFIIGGIVECLSYAGDNEDDEDRTWIITDGATTFVLGILIVMGKFSADAVVPVVLGLWIIVSGIRNIARVIEGLPEKGPKFVRHILIGCANIIMGLYTFFNSDIANISVIMMIGLCIIMQGINILNIGTGIAIKRPEFAKTNAEILEEAKAKANKAEKDARAAIHAAKKAKSQLDSAKKQTKKIDSMADKAMAKKTEKSQKSAKTTKTTKAEESPDAKQEM